MGTILTVVISVGLICLVLFFKRKEWFPENKKKGPAAYAVPTPESKGDSGNKEPAEKKTPKDSKISESVWKFFRPILGFALGVGLLMWIGFNFYSYFQSPGDNIRRNTIKLGDAATVTDSLDAAPEDLVLSVIADYESGDGTPGSGKQFEKDDEGNLIVYRGRVDKDDTGYLQINQRIHADLLQKTGIDVAKSKEDNVKFAKILKAKYGYEPWARSRYRWEPRLAALGFGSDTAMQPVEAPVENFGSEVIVPGGIYFTWGDSTDSFIVKDQKGSIARYDPKNGLAENLPYPSKTLVFKSLGDKPAIVKLRFGRTPLVKM